MHGQLNTLGQRSGIDYIICNEKLADMVLDISVFWGPEIESHCYLLLCPLSMKPRQYKNKQRPQNPELLFKVTLLSESSTKWLQH
jgi:hypothetical protein